MITLCVDLAGPQCPAVQSDASVDVTMNLLCRCDYLRSRGHSVVWVGLIPSVDAMKRENYSCPEEEEGNLSQDCDPENRGVGTISQIKGGRQTEG